MFWLSIILIALLLTGCEIAEGGQPAQTPAPLATTQPVAPATNPAPDASDPYPYPAP